MVQSIAIPLKYVLEIYFLTPINLFPLYRYDGVVYFKYVLIYTFFYLSETMRRGCGCPPPEVCIQRFANGVTT